LIGILKKFKKKFATQSMGFIGIQQIAKEAGMLNLLLIHTSSIEYIKFFQYLIQHNEIWIQGHVVNIYIFFHDQNY